MGATIVLREGEFGMEHARARESRVFEQIGAAARAEAVEYLERVDAALYERRPAGWVAVGLRERTLATRFGEVRLRRRLYREEQGGYHVLLDEYIGLSAHQAATPEMQAMCTVLCGELLFRKAAGFREQWMAGMLSHSTCWRLLQRTGEAAVRAGEEEVEAVFGRGEPIAPIGERCVERWYIEADGV